MSSYPVIVSFYTNDWDYPLYAEQLRENCNSLGLDCYIVQKDSLNDYVKNCNMKPFFIKEMLERFKKPILWMDVDGSIVSMPVLLSDQTVKDFDIAGNRSQRDRSRVHVGSIWFNYSPTTLSFVDAWCEAIVKQGIDDAVFNGVWTKFVDKIKFFELPPEYFVILPTPKSPVPADSCIVHRLSNSVLKQTYKHQVENQK